MPEAEQWYLGLDDKAADSIAAAFDLLAERGPTLRRPAVGLIRGSRHRNMKAARSFRGNLRALLVFDEDRNGVVLVGGDKTGSWDRWYERAIPVAEGRYDDYLELGGKGLSTWPIDRSRPGERSAGRGR
jgi:hypothetical protein